VKEARKAGQQNMAKTAKTSSAHVAVVGTGVIGASWAACFLAKGFDVVATDPAEGAEASCAAW
jgi:3-hydroxyacyl-CoA dehydrogenase